MCAFSFPPQIVNEDILDSLESSGLNYDNHLNAFKPSIYDYAVTIEIKRSINEEIWNTDRNYQFVEQTLDIICRDYAIDFVSFNEFNDNPAFDYFVDRISEDDEATWLLVIQMTSSVKIGEFMIRLGNVIYKYLYKEPLNVIFWVSEENSYVYNIKTASRWIVESSMIMDGEKMNQIRRGMLSNAATRLLKPRVEKEDSEEYVDYCATRDAIERYIYKIIQKKNK